MGGNYDPDDSWAQCHELLALLKDKVLEEEYHLAQLSQKVLKFNFFDAFGGWQLY